MHILKTLVKNASSKKNGCWQWARYILYYSMLRATPQHLSVIVRSMCCMPFYLVNFSVVSIFQFVFGIVQKRGNWFSSPTGCINQSSTLASGSLSFMLIYSNNSFSISNSDCCLTTCLIRSAESTADCCALNATIITSTNSRRSQCLNLAAAMRSTTVVRPRMTSLPSLKTAHRRPYAL